MLERADQAAGCRVGFDIGGTFTDFVMTDASGRVLATHKALTSYPDPSHAAIAGLDALSRTAGVPLAEVAEVVHGTTLVTNAVVERRGARTALITTRGFRDVLEAGTEQRYDIYDLFLRFPEPLVPRDLRREVDERIDATGRVVTALDAAEVRALLDALVADGIEAVAVCLLHSYANPVHERLVARIAAEAHPGLALSLSCEIAPEMGEYARSVTVAANAYVQPVVERYVSGLEAALSARGFRGAFRLMHSAGGLMSPASARVAPVRLLESGPAGGGLAAALFAGLAGHADALAFDMGGTTAKACLIESGELAVAAELEAAREHRFTRGSGLPIRTPVVDLIEIGAGGGSIAAVNEVGLMKVGPRSAGSVPGPACYGAGGTEPTVTDAALILGYYDPDYFLGGRMALDRAAAEHALAPLARALGLTVPEAAAGIHTLVVENMAAAARMHAVERGRDPRGYAMIAFGGAGPAHAASVAQALGLAEVIVPPGSGTASALGFLSAPLSFETVRSVVLPLAPGGLAGAAGVLEALESECRASLATAGGVPPGATVQRSADVRLVGQRHTVSVPLPDEGLHDGAAADLRAAFDAVYAARYAPPPEGAAAEVVALRVGVAGPARALFPQADPAQGTALKGRRPAWFGGGYVETPVYDRYSLAPGTEIAGPAIVEEAEATTVVPPTCRLSVDGTGCLRITLGPPVRTDLGIAAGLPLDKAKARLEADPTALEIMWSRAVTVTEEMWHTVCRTAFSLVISEAQDFACDLLDIHGETLAHSPRAMPVFNLTLPIAARALLKAFPVDTLRPGDVLLTNDPWLCAGHLFDIAVVTPVFRDGRVVALAGTVGNVSDIGGTRDWLHAREVYEEGFQIPPMKLVDAGVPNRTLLTLLEKNVRGADQVVGDIFSFVAANEIAARGLLALMDDYGMEDLTAFAAVVQGRSEAAMRAAIRALADGEHRGEAWTSPFGVPMQLPVKVTVAGDAMHIDFAGAPPQVGQGGINCTMSYTAAHATYPLKCMLTPEVRGNAGCYRPFSVAAPEGSIVNARYPASVNLRTRTGWYIAPAVFSALAPAAPGRVQAGTGLPFTSNIYGTTPAGERFADVLFTGGGQGASAGRPGRAGLLWPTSASNTSIEVFESRVPVLVIEKSFLPGTGGAGVQPGGDAQRVRFRKRDDDGHAIFATIYPEGTIHPPQGLFGGTPGTAAAALVVAADGGRILRDCETGALLELTSPREIIEVTVAGGGGFGAPEPGSGDGGSAEAAAGAKDNSRDRVHKSTQEVNEHA